MSARAAALAAAGAALLALYAALLVGQPHGPVEFAYAPFTPEPLPWAPVRGFTMEQLDGHVWRVLLVGPALGLLSLAVARWRASRDGGAARAPGWTPARVALVASCASVAVTAVMMLGVLRGRPIVDDESSYAMQGTFLGAGRVAQDVGYVPTDTFVVKSAHGYTAKYLFGEPVVQILGAKLGVPALVHLPLAALLLWAWFAQLRRAAGDAVAGWSTALLAISPMFVMTNATGLSHTTALACIVVAGLGYAWTRDGPAVRGALVCGAALAFGVATRPQSLVPAGAVIGLATLVALARRRAFAALATLIATLGAGAAALLAYCRAVTGSPWLLPWYRSCPPEHYGFGPVWSTDTFAHTWRTALENVVVTAVRFNAWWLGWPVALAIFAVWLKVGRPRAGASVWLGVGAAIFLFELGYYSTGVSDTGPIYHFELLLPASVVAGNTLVAALARWPRATGATIAVHAALGTLGYWLEQGLRIGRLVTAIHGSTDALLATLDGPAIVLYEPWRSEVRSMGWVHDAFPKRLRDPSARIVAYPRPPPARVAQLLARFPGRACWYYHRDHWTEAEELLPCARAQTFLARDVYERDPQTILWVKPTAFKVTGYDPLGASVARRRWFLDHHVVPCCAKEVLHDNDWPFEVERCLP